jgi:hypothetical protein
VPLVTHDNPLTVHLTKAHVTRIRAALVAHVLAAAGVLGLEAHDAPALMVVCVVAWVCIIVAPAVAVEIWLRALRRPDGPGPVLRKMLVAPLMVGWLALVTLVEVMARRI